MLQQRPLAAVCMNHFLQLEKCSITSYQQSLPLPPQIYWLLFLVAVFVFGLIGTPALL